MKRFLHAFRQTKLFGSLLLAAGFATSALAAEDAKAAPDTLRKFYLEFTENGDGSYAFNTGVLQGKLRPNGKSLGLSSVEYVPTQVKVDRGYGLLGHYRVFTTNQRYGGGAWDWPSTARLLPQGAVEVHWPAAEERPFEMYAIYRWRDRATLDVETIVKPRAELPKFEVFLASYFNDTFTNCLAYVQQNPESGGQPGFLAAKQSLGDWLMFPRDLKAALIIGDGRWKLAPNPVNWIILPPLAAPVAVRRAPGQKLSAVLMSSPQDCFAIATPQQAEGHYSLYFSLFGRDLKAGETARARSRLWIDTDLTDERIRKAYAEFLQSKP